MKMASFAQITAQRRGSLSQLPSIARKYAKFF